MRTSQRGIDLIKSFEGLSLKAVRLQGEQYWTIGYGHNGADVRANQVMTQAQAEALLRQDLVKFEGWVTQYAPWPTSQNEFDALVSFTYNCGPGNLMKLVSGRTKKQVASHMMVYTHSGSEAYRQGLINRRKKEQALFLTPVEDETMTGEEIYNALQEYTKTLQLPSWAKKEFNEAIKMGITDGSDPMMPIPRYQAALMSLRAVKKALEAK